MKVSDITVEFIASYLGYDDASVEKLPMSDKQQIEAIRSAAISFVESYTELSLAEIDKHEDITTVVLILCQDMYDNRSMYVDKSNINKVVEITLGMHRIRSL